MVMLKVRERERESVNIKAEKMYWLLDDRFSTKFRKQTLEFGIMEFGKQLIVENAPRFINNKSLDNDLKILQ